MSGLLTATGTKPIAGIHVHTSGGTKDVGFGRIRTPTGTEVFFQSLASGGGGATGSTPGITVDPTDVSGAVNSSSARTATTDNATVTVSGGVPPFSYLWVQVSGSPMTATAPTSASTAFEASVGPNVEKDAVWKCTVTDSAGVSADSPQVTADVENIGGTL